LGVLVVEVDIMVGATMMVMMITTRDQKEKRMEYEVIGYRSDSVYRKVS
jgi:hypothetical protein